MKRLDLVCFLPKDGSGSGGMSRERSAGKARTINFDDTDDQSYQPASTGEVGKQSAFLENDGLSFVQTLQSC